MFSLYKNQNEDFKNYQLFRLASDLANASCRSSRSGSGCWARWGSEAVGLPRTRRCSIRENLDLKFATKI
jgi:hypothetical protein